MPQEAYSLDVKYFYNPESFIVGNKAKIILHPTLELGESKDCQRVSLQLLKNIRIKVEMEDSENIRSAMTL